MSVPAGHVQRDKGGVRTSGAAAPLPSKAELYHHIVAAARGGAASTTASTPHAMDTDIDIGVPVPSKAARAATAASPTSSAHPQPQRPQRGQQPLTPHRPQQPRPHPKFSPHSAPTSFAQPTIFSALPPSPPSPSLPSSSPPLSAAASVRVQIESELLLPRVERRKLKKRRKEVERGHAKPAYIDVYGANARASIELKLSQHFRGERAGLRARDVHQLIGWAMGEDDSVRWAFIRNKALLVQVVLLIVDGLTRSVWTEHSSHFARLSAFVQQQTQMQLQLQQQSQPQPAPPAQQRPTTVEAGDDRKEQAEADSVQPVRVHIPSSLFSNDTVMQDWMSYHIRQQKPRDTNSSSSSTSTPFSSSFASPPTSTPPSFISSPASSPPPKRPKLDEQSSAHPSALHYILTPAQLVENKYPHVKEVGFLHSCDHHRLDERERARQVKASLATGWHCVHTHPCGVEGQEGKAVSPDVKIELLVERMEEAEADGLEDGELVEVNGGQSKGDEMEDVSGQHDASSPTSSSPPLFGIDCEMCYTAVGLELTRLTLIDSSHRILLDSFILPPHPILDYNTQYSGITAAMLANCTTTLEQVRHSLLLLLPSAAILVGHSLENDLRTARFVHLRCIDTAVLYPHPRGPPHKSSLRYLAKKWLNRDIQEGQAGHDSTEDAGAAMDLALEKIKRGPQWGVQPKTTELLTDVLTRWHRKVAFIDRAESAQRWAGQSAAVMSTMSDEQTTDRTVKAVMSAQQDVVIAHFHSLWSSLEKDAEEGGEGQGGEGRAGRVGEACRHLDGLLASALKASRPNSLLMLVSGQGSAAHVKAMQRQRVERSEGAGVKGDEVDAAIGAAVAQLQDGMAWFAVRQ